MYTIYTIIYNIIQYAIQQYSYSFYLHYVVFSGINHLILINAAHIFIKNARSNLFKCMHCMQKVLVANPSWVKTCHAFQ